MLHLVRVVTSLCDNAVKKALWPVCTAFLLFLGILALPAALAHGQTQVSILPKYQILGVVYAPPGSASNVTYGQSDMVGTSNTIGSSVEQNYGIAITVGYEFSAGPFGGWGFGDTLSTGWTETSGQSSTVSVQTQINNAVSTPGPVSSSLGVNHDNDVIYILLNPVMETQTNGSNALSLTGIESNSCDITDAQFTGSPYQALGGCDPNQYPFPDIVAIPVWCLKNPYYPAQSCAQWLPYTSRSWDTANWGADPVTNLPLGPMLTLQDYADILSADPFVTQTLVPANTVANFYCHQSSPYTSSSPANAYSYGVNLDPNDVEAISATPPPATNLKASGCEAAGGSYASSTGTCTWPKNFCAPPASTSTTCANAGGNFVSGSCAFSNPISAQRFTPFDTVQYPEPGIDGEPQTYTGSISYQNSTQNAQNSTSTSSISNTLCVEFGAGGSCPDANGKGGGGVGSSFSVTSGFTWTNTQSTSTTTADTSTASYSITGPQLSDNYTGPTTYNVYEDNVFGTFAFYSNLQREQPAIELSGGVGSGVTSWATNGLGVSATPGVYVSPITVTDLTTNASVATPTPGITVLSFSALTNTSNITTAEACNPPYPPTYPATCPATQTAAPLLHELQLTNNSPYQMTMAGPAITFGDPGFQVLYGQNSSGQNYDTCSNQVLQSQTTCTIWVQFSPVTSDAPSQNETNPVSASLVAAGTENITGYQNILVTSTGVIATGIATTGPVYLGATLVCTPQNGTTCVNNQYNFGTISTYNTSLTENFQFTNTSSSSMTVTQVKLSDFADFYVNSITCSTTANPITTCPSNGSIAGSAIVANNPIENANGLSIVVPAGGSITLQLTFAPAGVTNGVLNTGITVLGTVYGGASTTPGPLAGAAAVGTSNRPTYSVNPSSINQTFYYELNSGGNSCAALGAGYSPTQTISITNYTPSPFTPSVASAGSASSILLQEVQASGSNACSVNSSTGLYSVPPNGGSCTIALNIEPFFAPGGCPASTTGSESIDTLLGPDDLLSVNLTFAVGEDCAAPGCPDINGYNGSNSDIVVSRPNPIAPIVVGAGSSGSTALMITAGKNFSGNVSFACQNLPANTSCAFNPPTVALAANGSQSTNLTVSVAASNTMARRGNRPFFPLSALAALLCFAGLNKRSRSKWMFLVLIGLAGFASLSACGGAGGGSSQPLQTTTTSTISVVATSGNVSTTLGVPVTITQ